jgi:hypothetical protein
MEVERERVIFIPNIQCADGSQAGRYNSPGVQNHSWYNEELSPLRGADAKSRICICIPVVEASDAAQALHGRDKTSNIIVKVRLQTTSVADPDSDFSC